jgi:hypothetical protein
MCNLLKNYTDGTRWSIDFPSGTGMERLNGRRQLDRMWELTECTCRSLQPLLDFNDANNKSCNCIVTDHVDAR